VRLDGGPSEEFKELTIWISFVEDAFCVFWTNYSRGGKSGSPDLSASSEGQAAVTSRVREFLESRGFVEVTSEWYSRRINGVELELSLPSEVTLGKCLFNDYDG
jgi:hypothetical protein